MSTVSHLECSVCGQASGSRQNPYPVRMRRTASGPLRSRKGTRNVEPRIAGRRAQHPCGATLPVLPVRDPQHIVSLGEGMTPLLKTVPPRRHAGSERSLGEGRRPQPHRLVQSSRPIVRHIDVRRTRHSQSRHTIGGQCRKRAGRLRRRGRNRIAYLHAARCSAIQLHRMPRLRSARHAGGRPDQRLRAHRHRAQGRRRMVRISTLKEPYRIEGKKTMGYEVAEQFGWTCPTRFSIPPAAASA